MALGYDTKNTTGPATTNPLTLSYTCGATAKILVLMIVAETTTARTGGSPTYNSVTMTQAGTAQAGSAECNAELWYLLDPPTGSAYTVSVPNSGSANIRLIVSSYTGTGAALFGTPQQTGTSSATPSLTINSVPAGGMTVAVLGHGYKDPPTGRSDSVLYETDHGAYSSNGQYSLRGSAGNVTMSWTLAGSDDVAMIMAAFKEVLTLVVNNGSQGQTAQAPSLTQKHNLTAANATQSQASVSTPIVADSYSETNVNLDYELRSGSNTGVGQAFYGDGKSLYSAKFYIKKYGSPTGNAVAKLYLETHDTAFGTDSYPTGSALATSNNKDVSTLTESYALVEFIFPTPYTLSNGTAYIITVEYSGGDADNLIYVGLDSTSPTDDGNYSRYNVGAGGWYGWADRDCAFYVYGYSSTVTLSVIHVLAVQNASQTQAATSPVLESTGALTVQDAAQGQAVQAPTLTQLHVLAVANSSQGHAAEGNLVLEQTTPPVNLTVQNASQTHFSDNPITDIGAFEAPFFVETTNLSVQNGSMGQVAQAPALTQQHILTSVDASQTQASTSPTLESAANLVLQDGAQAQTAIAPVLTQLHILTNQNAAQTQAATEPTLTQLHILVNDNANQSQTAQAPTLTQLHELSAENGSQSQQADNAVITQTHILSAANATQAQAAESPALSQTHSLAAQDAAQGQTSGNVTLSQLHELIAANAAQAMTAENPTLTGAGTLSIQDVSQGQTAQSPALTQLHTLIAQAASQSMTAEGNINLVPIYYLALQNALQSQVTDAVVLTQLHELVISNLTQGMSSSNIVLTTDIIKAIVDQIDTPQRTKYEIRQLESLVLRSLGEDVTNPDVFNTDELPERQITLNSNTDRKNIAQNLESEIMRYIGENADMPDVFNTNELLSQNDQPIPNRKLAPLETLEENVLRQIGENASNPDVFTN